MRQVFGSVTRRSSVRARVLLGVVALAGLALLLSGVTAYLFARTNVYDSAEDYLRRTAENLRIESTTAIDPATGVAHTDPETLLAAVMDRDTLARNEGEFGLVGDKAILPVRPGPLTPWNIGELVQWAKDAPADSVTTRNIEVDGIQYAYAVVPVHLAHGSGRFVRVLDLTFEVHALNDTYMTYAVVAAAALILVGLTTWAFMGRLLAPIAELRRIAEEINEHDLSRRIAVSGQDDLTALSITVNAMLDRLEDAVAGQRQLLDDVGHELRTPLTIVRGHLELMDVNCPDDVGITRSLAMDELDRMGRLVTDLIDLAKAGRVDFIHPELVDVALFTDETLEKARGLGERRWQLDSLADTSAMIDPQRIAQGWLQLAANAVRYSEADTTISMGSAVVDGQLHLWVSDEGEGIDPADHERIFQRFSRVGAHRTEGGGLGLAIVASIAAAHEGRVEVRSAKGEGATFTLVLPLNQVTKDDAHEQHSDR